MSFYLSSFSKSYRLNEFFYLSMKKIIRRQCAPTRRQAIMRRNTVRAKEVLPVDSIQINQNVTQRVPMTNPENNSCECIAVGSMRCAPEQIELPVRKKCRKVAIFYTAEELNHAWSNIIKKHSYFNGRL